MKKYLHLCHGDKFTGPLVSLINEELTEAKHEFFVVERNVKYPLPPASNLVKLGDFRTRLHGLLSLVCRMNKAERVVLHGLFGSIVYVLFLQPWLLGKVCWVIWGGDLYRYQEPDKSLRRRVDERIRHFVIRRIGYLETWIEGDAALARRWYGAKGKYVECLMYLSNVFDPLVLPMADSDTLVILVGNSADPSNRHLEVFAQLRLLDDGVFNVVCPLSYGDAAYAKGVVAEGERIFGKRFVPLLDFLSIDKYRQILAQIDIAVFAHRRQQAMGNTISLLGYGKTVYMRNDVTPWQTFKDKGITVHALDTLSLKLQDPEVSERNKAAVRRCFSRDVLVSQLKRMFQ